MSEPAPRPAPGLIAPVLSGVAALALAADQLRLGFGARSAEVSHLLGVPPLWFWIPIAVLLLAALGVGVWGARVRRDARLSRVPLLGLVLVAFLDALVLPPVRPLAASADGYYAVRAFADEVELLAESLGRLPSTVEELDRATNEQMEPPYLVRGQPIAHWSLVVRSDCKGPVLEPAGLATATYVYCLSGDHKTAWITAVGRSTSTFGPPEVLTYSGKPVVEALNAPPREEDEPGPVAPDAGP